MHKSKSMAFASCLHFLKKNSFFFSLKIAVNYLYPTLKMQDTQISQEAEVFLLVRIWQAQSPHPSYPLSLSRPEDLLTGVTLMQHPGLYIPCLKDVCDATSPLFFAGLQFEWSQLPTNKVKKGRIAFFYDCGNAFFLPAHQATVALWHHESHGLTVWVRVSNGI